MAIFDPDNIPVEMRIRNQWVLWKYRIVNGRMIIVTYQTNGKKADPTKPETLSSFGEVCKMADNFNGIGFVFTEESGIMSLYFNHVKKDGEWGQEAPKEIMRFNSYAEFSPDGEGAHVYIKRILHVTGKER